MSHWLALGHGTGNLRRIVAVHTCAMTRVLSPSAMVRASMTGHQPSPALIRPYRLSRCGNHARKRPICGWRV